MRRGGIETALSAQCAERPAALLWGSWSRRARRHTGTLGADSRPQAGCAAPLRGGRILAQALTKRPAADKRRASAHCPWRNTAFWLGLLSGGAAGRLELAAMFAWYKPSTRRIGKHNPLLDDLDGDDVPRPGDDARRISSDVASHGPLQQYGGFLKHKWFFFAGPTFCRPRRCPAGWFCRLRAAGIYTPSRGGSAACGLLFPLIKKLRRGWYYPGMAPHVIQLSSSGPEIAPISKCRQQTDTDAQRAYRMIVLGSGGDLN